MDNMESCYNGNQCENRICSEEIQYLDLINTILKDNNIEEGRNGKVYVSFGNMMKFKLSDNILPFLTTKKLAWKSCLKELLWFISGSTDNEILQNQNVKINAVKNLASQSVISEQQDLLNSENSTGTTNIEDLADKDEKILKNEKIENNKVKST